MNSLELNKILILEFSNLKSAYQVFSDELINLLRDFRDELRNYIAEDDNDDEAIIKDPNWQIVVKKAQKVIVAWNKYKQVSKNDQNLQQQFSKRFK